MTITRYASLRGLTYYGFLACEVKSKVEASEIYDSAKVSFVRTCQFEQQLQATMDFGTSIDRMGLPFTQQCFYTSPFPRPLHPHYSLPTRCREGGGEDVGQH